MGQGLVFLLGFYLEGTLPFVVLSKKTTCTIASPLSFGYFSNHLKYLTRQGFPGLLNVMNLIMHSS